MRITEKNTPVLKYLKWRRPLSEHPDFGTDRLGVFAVQSEDAPSPADQANARLLSAFFVAGWGELAGHFSECVEVISEPFNEAMWKNAPKVFNEQTVGECTGGTFRGTLIHGGVSLCYDFTMNAELQIAGNLMMHVKDNLALLVNGPRLFISETARRFYGIPDWDVVKNTFKEVLILHLFKKYAETESVKAVPFKKVRLQEGDSLLVDSTIPLAYLDCRWFREIVRNEGFMVKGHFRLQPYKRNGTWTKKLIYIQPFQKHGYVRRALKDIQQNKENQN